MATLRLKVNILKNQTGSYRENIQKRFLDQNFYVSLNDILDKKVKDGEIIEEVCLFKSFVTKTCLIFNYIVFVSLKKVKLLNVDLNIIKKFFCLNVRCFR